MSSQVESSTQAEAAVSIARTASKKTLYSAQNLENKRSEFFLPSRSMVLKVVTGKILETWELRWIPAVAVPFGNCGQINRLSKIYDYLIDNQYIYILSCIEP